MIARLRRPLPCFLPVHGLFVTPLIVPRLLRSFPVRFFRVSRASVLPLQAKVQSFGRFQETLNETYDVVDWSSVFPTGWFSRKNKNYYLPAFRKLWNVLPKGYKIQALRWADKCLIHGSPNRRVTRAAYYWRKFPFQLRNQLLGPILLWALVYSPRRAVTFIRVISVVDPAARTRLRANVLNYVCYYHVSKTDESSFEKIDDVLLLIDSSTNPPYSSRLCQSLLYSLLAHANSKQLTHLYLQVEQMATDGRLQLYGWTLLHFLMRFCDNGQLDLARRAIAIAPEIGIHFSRVYPHEPSFRLVLQKGITHLLQTIRQQEPETLVRTFNDLVNQGFPLSAENSNVLIDYHIARGAYRDAWNVCEVLLRNKIPFSESVYCSLLKQAGQNFDLGVLQSVIQATTKSGMLPGSRTLTVAIQFQYNVLIALSLQRNDLDGAFTILRNMKEHGIQPSAFTCLLFLRDADRRRDFHVMEIMIEEIDQQGYFQTEDILPFQVMAYVSNLYESDQSAAYEAMLYVYKRYFSLEPFVQLGIMSKDQVPENSPTCLPPLAVLSILYCAFIRQCRDVDVLRDLYLRYEEFTSAGNDPLLSRLAQAPHVATTFLIAFGSFNETLENCTPVVQFMLRAPSAPPDVYTWSALLFAFMKHRQALAAEKVLTIMKGKGIEPNVVTYNSLISGYVEQKEVDMILDVIGRMEMEGVETDEKTFSILANKKIVERLREAIRRSEAERIRREGERLSARATDQRHGEIFEAEDDDTPPAPHLRSTDSDPNSDPPLEDAQVFPPAIVDIDRT